MLISAIIVETFFRNWPFASVLLQAPWKYCNAITNCPRTMYTHAQRWRASIFSARLTILNGSVAEETFLSVCLFVCLSVRHTCDRATHKQFQIFYTVWYSECDVSGFLVTIFVVVIIQNKSVEESATPVESAITWKRCEIRCNLVLFTNRKSHTGFRLIPKSLT